MKQIMVLLGYFAIIFAFDAYFQNRVLTDQAAVIGAFLTVVVLVIISVPKSQ